MNRTEPVDDIRKAIQEMVKPSQLQEHPPFFVPKKWVWWMWRQGMVFLTDKGLKVSGLPDYRVVTTEGSAWVFM